MNDAGIFIIGANGQLGSALQTLYPGAQKADIDELDITNAESVKNFDWSNIKVIINAAAYTNVDGAETPAGRTVAWQVNDQAVGHLVDIAKRYNLLLVHISTAYVFDGQKKLYNEADSLSPLGEYAKTKAAADKRVSQLKRFYIVRTDSVIGKGKNFVRTMLKLGHKGISPSVVADQIIRPTFTGELARAIKYLIDSQAAFGVYNLTNEGEPVSWADFTRAIFKQADINLPVSDTTLAAYSASKPGIAPRPLNSVLDLSKIEALGFRPKDWRDDLKAYLKVEQST